MKQALWYRQNLAEALPVEVLQAPRNSMLAHLIWKTPLSLTLKESKTLVMVL